MFEGRTFLEQSYPAVTSDFWKPKANELFDQLTYFDEASSELRNNVWVECMKAYLCKFELPYNEGLDWVSEPEGLFETDIWEAVNKTSEQILGTLLNRDGSYMEMLSSLNEDQATLNDIRDLMMSINRRSDLRGQYGKHIKQLLIFGTSALWWQWLDKQVWTGARGPVQAREMLLAEGVEIPEDDAQFNRSGWKKYKFLRQDYVGPVVRAIDPYDFWMDPVGDLAIDRDVPIITRFFLTKEDLENALDEDGNKKYDNLDGIEPQTIERILQDGNDHRMELMHELGLTPTFNEGSQGQRLVPVYMFHQPVRKFHDDKSVFTDTFFYCAEVTGKGSNDRFKVIRVEPNPHRNGSRGIYIDSYIDSPAQITYGIGAVEKSVKAWQVKCIISELGLCAAVSSVYPALNVVGGYLQDDVEYKVAPGSLNIIKAGPLGPNFAAPIPAPLNGVPLGQSVEQWHGQKILGQFGSMSVVSQQDPTKSIKQSKTATQVNVEASTGSVMLDSVIEKLSTRSLEPLLQDLYDATRQYCKDPTFERQTASGNMQIGTIAKEKLDIDRRVIATGYRSMVNKAKRIEEYNNILAVMSTGNAMQMMPNLMAVYQQTLFDLLGILGVRNLDQYKQDPIMLVLQHPQVQQQLMQLLANPQALSEAMMQAQMAQGQGMQQDAAYGQPVSTPGSEAQSGEPQA